MDPAAPPKGLRGEIWLMVALVAGASVLLEVFNSRLQQVIVAVILFFSHDVTPYYDAKSLERHIFWLGIGLLLGRLITALVMGCLVAWAVKGREIAAAVSLGLVCLALEATVFWVLVATHSPVNPRFFSSVMIQQLGASCMAALGGVIVREIRSARRAVCN